MCGVPKISKNDLPKISINDFVPKMPEVEPYVAPPKEEDSAVQEAIRKERELAKKRKGRQSTILNGGAGILDGGTKKTMLGE